MIANNFNAEEVLLIFGMNIKRARQNKNLTLSELSQLAHYDRISLSNIEVGKQNVKLNTAIKLARTLNEPFPSLFSRNYMNLTLENDGLIDSGYIEDDYLGIFVENFRRCIKELHKHQMSAYFETWIPEASVSRIMQRKNRNPTLVTLNSLAYVAKNELSTMFSRMN